ncbi:hypothetical protein [Sphingobacterium sp. ML3W]|uniref:hypothetical protein n=1 Tax=Sphingobacterium sp. ML3W TaxID=1538644 RepID=UPI00068E8306|nr:hypothetical protein [Sphingobacterium sp. ML3W]
MIFHPSGLRQVTFESNEKEIQFLRTQWKLYMTNVPDYPKFKYRGKGIVYTAGGITYTICAWVSISSLRSQGCFLPIELWYMGNELSTEMIYLFKSLDVECKNFHDYGVFEAKGFILKPLAILYSNFEEVLFLDADNICYGSPDTLFEDKKYKEFGTIFWPDYWYTGEDNPIWKIVNSPYDQIHEQESGQILINKAKCWNALNLCIHFNKLGDEYYYKMILGDKDTFKFAWIALETEFYMVEYYPDSCGIVSEDGNFYGNTIVQYNSEGELFFLHKNLLKWDITLDYEITWQQIKSFKHDAEIQQTIFVKNNTGLISLDLVGDVELIDFRENYGTIEDNCNVHLRNLRNLPEFYRFVQYSHFATRRYLNGIKS